MTAKIKVLLVDDHDILMDGIESILNESDNIKVVGKASSVAKAVTLIKQCRPELVLTDISMGEVSGLELTKLITHQFPLIKIIMLTMHDDKQHMTASMEAGASGYLLKNIKQEELFLAIDNVMAGRQYIQHSIAQNFCIAMQDKKVTEKQSVLSPREIEIIRLIASDLSTTEISKRLFISELTVGTHRKNIGRKTGIKTIIGLLHYAEMNGLL